MAEQRKGFLEMVLFIDKAVGGGYVVSINSLAITVKPKTNKRTFRIEMDADRLERLVANFGLFNPDFLKSIARAEDDYKAGRAKRIRSLRELRK
ncbi:MAG: hypothetical protein AAB869_01190 [Patescibacteria group bacterium]